MSDGVTNCRPPRKQAGAKIKTVIAGLDPAIHPLHQKSFPKTMDARVKPAHDDLGKPLLRGDRFYASNALRGVSE
jgi:hypothetical protein